jgi:hypothetical protein
MRVRQSVTKTASHGEAVEITLRIALAVSRNSHAHPNRDPFRAVLAEESGGLVRLLGADEERQVFRHGTFSAQCGQLRTMASASSAALGVVVASWARMCAKWRAAAA